MAAALAVSAAGCGGSGSHRATGPTTTLLQADTWSPPAVGDSPGTPAFCTLVVSVYEHMAQLPVAATNKVKEQILGDYVAQAPRMIALAPPAVAADAQEYFQSVAVILGDLQHAGLNGSKITDANARVLLLDPRVKTAGNNVIGFVQTNCHYTIGG